jgi:hypothetical protein
MLMTNIKIKGCAAFAQEVNFPLSAIVAIQGKNRQGKSALIACLTYPFRQGHDPDMVNGESGEIVVTFDDGSMVRATVTKEKTERMVKPAGSVRWDRSRKYIDDISNAVSFDPVGFLKLEEKKQVETLLKVMPLDMKVEEMKAAIAGFEALANGACAKYPNASALETINSVRRAIYDERTATNAAADTHTKYADEMERSLKAMDLMGDANWEGEVERLREAERQRAAIEMREQEELRMEFVEYRAKVQADVDKLIEAKRAECAQRKNEITAAHSGKRTELAADLATANARLETKLQSRGQEEAIRKARAAAAESAKQSEAMTAAIGRLDELKRAVASRLPIQGIEIQDGRILRKEGERLVPFVKWSFSDQVLFCLRIAVLAHGKAGFICLDDAEHLDKERRVMLARTARKYAEEQGLQFIIATVDDGPLAVTDGSEGI